MTARARRRDRRDSRASPTLVDRGIDRHVDQPGRSIAAARGTGGAAMHSAHHRRRE
jgi:hypothetical protein